MELGSNFAASFVGVAAREVRCRRRVGTGEAFTNLLIACSTALRQTAADDTFDDNRRAATEARLNNVRPSTNTSTTSSQGTGQADRRSTVTSAVPSMYSGPGNLARDLNNARNLVGSDRYLITLEARCTNLGAAWKEENKFAPQGNDFNSTEPFAQVLDALFEKVVGPWWKQAEDAPLAR